MSTFMDKCQKESTTEQGNTSQLVTKSRQAFESSNGRLKSWKYFEKVLPNSYGDTIYWKLYLNHMRYL